MPTNILIKPICLTCGVRDDETEVHGFCQNGHDNWFELLDINEPSLLNNALEATGFSKQVFLDLFCNTKVNKIRILPKNQRHVQ